MRLLNYTLYDFFLFLQFEILCLILPLQGHSFVLFVQVIDRTQIHLQSLVNGVLTSLVFPVF